MFTQVVTPETLESAWHRVRENQGCAGVDGQTPVDFESGLVFGLKRLGEEPGKETHRPLPLLRIRVEKSEGKSRALCVPTVRDRVAQTAVLVLIEPILSTVRDVAVYVALRRSSGDSAPSTLHEDWDRGGFGGPLPTPASSGANLPSAARATLGE